MGGLGLRLDIRRPELLPVPVTGGQLSLACAHLSHFAGFCVGLHELAQARFMGLKESASIPILLQKHLVLFHAPETSADPVISSAPAVDRHWTNIFPTAVESPRTLAENTLDIVARQLGEHDLQCQMREFLVSFRWRDGNCSTAVEILPILVYQQKALDGLSLAEP